MPRSILNRLAVAMGALGALLLPGCRSLPEAARPLGRTIWVDRWDWRSPQDIERVMADCQAAGFTAVMFQVRGNGTALWRSAAEVWSEKFDHKDPGFDPLATAVAAAHGRGMQLHAWLNVFPGWSGAKPPTDPRQLWQARPDWFLQDRDGDRQSLAQGKYVTLNPCLPEVRRYIADLCRELATGYRIDGVHLDYVRFPDPDPQEPELGTDLRTLGLFTNATGRSRGDSARLLQWQAECVTRTVEDVATVVRKVPGRRLLLTAAVFADLRTAQGKVRQDWPEWCRRGLVDAVLPMNYVSDDAVFARHARENVAAAGRVPVVMGVALYKHQDGRQSVQQLELSRSAGAAGVAVFSYRTLFGGPAAHAASGGAGDRGPGSAAMRDAVLGWLGKGAR